MILAKVICDKSDRKLAKQGSISQSRVTYARTVLEYARELADQVISGAYQLDDAYQTAIDRKTATNLKEELIRYFAGLHQSARLTSSLPPKM
jgi:hypothetical protein